MMCVYVLYVRTPPKKKNTNSKSRRVNNIMSNIYKGMKLYMPFDFKTYHTIDKQWETILYIESLQAIHTNIMLGMYIDFTP